jgi:hypothetical protein
LDLPAADGKKTLMERAAFGALLPLVDQEMFHLPIPLTEKIGWPVIVYLCLVVLLRLFGKRELA